MNKLFKKENVLAIPNLLSLFRLLLIPVIVWLYCVRESYHWTIIVIVLSGLSDILDGIIARKFNMVSDLGKILDPCADKLTQAAILICLAVRYPLIRWLLLFFALKELIMAVMGWIAIKYADVVNGAKWHGKVNTVLLYTVMLVLILFPDMTEKTANLLILICGIFMLVSLILYVRFYLKLFRQYKDEHKKAVK